MDTLADGYMRMLALPSFLLAFWLSLLVFREWRLRVNAILVLGFLTAMAFAILWVGCGVGLKYHDDHQIRQREGIYASYTESQIDLELERIRAERVSMRNFMTGYAIGYFILISGITAYSMRFFIMLGREQDKATTGN